MVHVEKAGPVLRLTLDRPDHQNAFNYEEIVQLTDTLSTAASERDVRVVVIEGSGEDFSVGEDWADMGAWPARYSNRHHKGLQADVPVPQQELLRKLWRLPRPTVAVIRGSAVGFGLDLACACDVRIIADDARIGDPRICDGVVASTGITYLLPRLIGLSQAARILMLGEVIDGKEAQRIGLAYRAVPSAELGAEAELLIAKLATMATRSYALIKRQIIEQLDLDHDMALLHSLAIRQTHVIEDQREGLQAFREKRSPVFSGR